MNQSPAKNKIEELEGLRGVAAIAVLAHHVSDPLQQLGYIGKIAYALLIPMAQIAVIIFFVLSGFVIGRTSAKEFNLVNAKNYVLRRLIRLCPIYLVAVALSFWVVGANFSGRELIAHLLFLQGTFSPVVSSNGPLWSLHYEAVYYSLFLLIWLFPKSFSWFFWLSVVCVLVGVRVHFIEINVMTLFGFWLFGLWLATKRDYQNGIICSNNGAFWFPFFLICANLSVGIWGGVVKKFGGTNAWFFEIFLNGPLIVSLFLSVLNLRLVNWIFTPACLLSLLTSCLGLGYGLHAGLFPQMACYPMGMTFLILGLFAKILVWPLPSQSFWRKMAWSGSVSYALYVIHYPVLKWATTVLSQYCGLIGASAFAVLIALAGAWVLEHQLQPLLASRLKTYLVK